MLLTDLAKPFELPNKNQLLRFRYTTYMGEDHPAQDKVVVQFCPDDVPDLEEWQRNKLIKLCGTRYNPELNVVKMSSESFDTQMQNKRYLTDVINTLIKEAKDATDTFEDVPFDFRHHKVKPRYEFPKEWIMTPERKEALEQGRLQAKVEEIGAKEQGRLLDGTAIIQNALLSGIVASQPVPEMVAAKGRGNRRLR
jgi:small subunit ribosomal protein S35